MLRPEKRSSREEQQFPVLESKVGELKEKSVRLLAGVIVTVSIEPTHLRLFCLYYRVLSASCGLPIVYVLPGPVSRM